MYLSVIKFTVYYIYYAISNLLLFNELGQVELRAQDFGSVTWQTERLVHKAPWPICKNIFKENNLMLGRQEQNWIVNRGNVHFILCVSSKKVYEVCWLLIALDSVWCLLAFSFRRGHSSVWRLQVLPFSCFICTDQLLYLYNRFTNVNLQCTPLKKQQHVFWCYTHLQE